MRKLGVQFLAIIGICTSLQVSAHSEHDKARFVAPDGQDTGRCENRFRPCRTIAYAAKQAGKGDKVLLAEGQYTVTNKDDLFYLISETVPVKGGYSRVDHYQEQSPDKHHTLLVGIPNEYVEALSLKGFDILKDGKASQLSTQISQQLKDAQVINQAHKAAQCSDGSAEGFPCSNVSLLSHVPLSSLPGNPTEANDIWGHVDLNTQREYAIIGLRGGVAVVDVTDPENPTNVGSVTGRFTTWRDIKVYQYFDDTFGTWRAYAYVTADSTADGLVIIDLNDLSNGVSIAGRQNDDQRAHNIYISNVDYGLNIAAHPDIAPQIHIMGSENFGGALRSYSLTSPTAPAPSYLPNTLGADDYSHDASSLLIDDERVNTDCVFENQGTCTVLLDFNEGTLRLWDHTMQTQSTELAEVSYSNAEYTHSGWWSEDKQYVVLHDELDESRLGLNTRVMFFDITNLTAPTLAATWEGPTAAIDHNGFARGDRYYMSNYERGLTILDISDPTAPEEAGYFDTFPVSDSAAFNGAWGVYPFLPSGSILVSDIQGGLYILSDDTKTNEANTVGLVTTSQTTDEGQTVTFDVARTGTDAMSVDYQIIFGNVSQTDTNAEKGTLNWAQNDTANQTISISVNDDGIQEANETLFISLVNPQSASLQTGQALASLTISGALVNRGSVTFTTDAATFKETDGTVNIDVVRAGGRQSTLTVNYQLVSDTAVAGEDISAMSGEITWQDGEDGVKTIPLTITNDTLNESNESLSLTLMAAEPDVVGELSSLAITIRDDESNQAPVVNAGNDTQVNTRASVSLAGSASDPETQSISVSWTQTSGTNVALNEATSLSPSFTAPATSSTLVFELRAIDDFGVESTDSVTVTVVAAATTPTPTPPANTSSGDGGSTSGLTLALLALILVWRLRPIGNESAKK